MNTTSTPPVSISHFSAYVSLPLTVPCDIDFVLGTFWRSFSDLSHHYLVQQKSWSRLHYSYLSLPRPAAFFNSANMIRCSCRGSSQHDLLFFLFLLYCNKRRQ